MKDERTRLSTQRRDAIGRREFTIASAMAILSGVAITVSGCSGGSDSGSSTPTSPSPSPGGGGAVGVVAANHGHSASISQAEITAGGDLSLDITGSANHPHTVQLSGAELGQIGAGQRVSKGSSTGDGHTHTVTFN